MWFGQHEFVTRTVLPLTNRSRTAAYMIKTAIETARTSGRDLMHGPIARGSIQSLLIRVAGLGLAFVTAIITARLLGPEGYGVLAFVGSLVSIFATVSVLGLGPLAVRKIPSLLVQADHSGISGFLRQSIKLASFAALVFAVALVVVAKYTSVLPANSFTVYAIAALMVLPQTLLLLISSWSRSFGLVAASQVPGEIIRPILVLCLLASAYFAGLAMRPETFLAAMLAAATVILFISLAWLWKRESKSISAEAKPLPAASTVWASMPFLGIALISMLQGEVNTLMLSWLSGPRETGLFQPILRFSNLMTIGVTAAGVAYAPKIAELWERGDIDTIRSITAKFTLTTFIVTVTIALAIAAFGPWILAAFGPEFVSVAPVLWIMAATQIFNAACGPVGLLLIVSKKTWQILVAQFLALCVNCVIGLFLIPTMGVKGAVIAVCGSTLFWNTLLVAASRKYTRVDATMISVAFRS